jgi:hypothetical protein
MLVEISWPWLAGGAWQLEVVLVLLVVASGVIFPSTKNKLMISESIDSP